ncbi:hypothetical protein KL86DYS1_11205 [uncultured Dysgonomonas sp.]|uniref:Uncharacterized protein n=1 Tax=uncultured Dysgonomonas sp. TaxID=206096 RepID=A0A212J5H4_9BACT|nr:hypothetical protein KL86DYS1_11205 [uncultured Dysgonomonas sp.]
MIFLLLSDLKFNTYACTEEIFENIHYAISVFNGIYANSSDNTKAFKNR